MPTACSAHFLLPLFSPAQALPFLPPSLPRNSRVFSRRCRWSQPVVMLQSDFLPSFSYYFLQVCLLGLPSSFVWSRSARYLKSHALFGSWICKTASCATNLSLFWGKEGNFLMVPCHFFCPTSVSFWLFLGGVALAWLFDGRSWTLSKRRPSSDRSCCYNTD